ncbi:MAG: hypothetical protein A2Z88_00815 [Omnitrophica WOR_2 bacterium GWA2_47_8]|nr:MAG: hypothetical protein A2Z88_00815 [Omnitrophica WOR_2 bacterium GWA2_47_8]
MKIFLTSKLHFKDRNGFSLVEVLVTAGIVVLVSLGLFRVFITCSLLAEMAGNLTTAIVEAEDKMEEIRNVAFDTIVGSYSSGGTPGNTFTIPSFNAMGVVNIDPTTSPNNADLLKVEVNVSWRNKDGRVVGEDKDLDGTIDGGEDINSNNILDSTAKIITYIARK